MAIFLKKLKIQLDDVTKDYRAEEVYYRIVPQLLISNHTSSTLYPYDIYFVRYKPEDDVLDEIEEYVGLIYLTRHELKLLDEKGLIYFNYLLEKSDTDII
jgi:hypothetical protein